MCNSNQSPSIETDSDSEAVELNNITKWVRYKKLGEAQLPKHFKPPIFSPWVCPIGRKFPTLGLNPAPSSRSAIVKRIPLLDTSCKQNMYRTLRTFQTLFKPVYQSFSSRRTVTNMSKLLKKPVKMALVQLASGLFNLPHLREASLTTRRA